MTPNQLLDWAAAALMAAGAVAAWLAVIKLAMTIVGVTT